MMPETLAVRTLSPPHWLALLLLGAVASCGAGPSSSPKEAPLTLERTIPLAGVAGRIDHMVLDREGQRLFVAELGNNTVEAVDLKAGRGGARISGQSEPQGLAWLPAQHALVVASGDGRVGFYAGDGLTLVGELKIGDDADNLRVDATGRPVLGYGAGALAVLDPVRRTVVATVRLPAHPEAFSLDGARAYVNVPDAAHIVAVDLTTGAQIAAWPTPGARFNFPMALDHRVLAVVFRLPARLRLLDPATGRTLLDTAACGDADDLFFDPPRRRLYVICGSGGIDVFQATGASDYRRTAHIVTRPGARTGLFAAQDDRLYVAARATGGQPAAILVYRPAN